MQTICVVNIVNHQSPNHDNLETLCEFELRPVPPLVGEDTS